MQFVKIRKIMKKGIVETYDLHTPIYHNFILKNGIISHNSGKTTLNHRIRDQLVEKQKALVIEINDRKMETGDYALEWDEPDFIEELGKVNEITKPEPIWFLHPINDKLDSQHMLYENKLGFKISIPFQEVMKDISIFSCYYDLGGSEQYFQNLIIDEKGNIKKDGLLFCKTLEEMNQLVDDNTQTKQNIKAGKDCSIPFGSAGKIKTLLKNLWKTKIFDISNGVNAKGNVIINGIKYEAYPWIIGLLSGLSTSIETSHIVKEPYYPALLKFFMTNIFEEKRRNPLLRKERIVLLADEIPDLMRNKKAYDIIDEAQRAMRSEGIGSVLTTQYYEEILPSVRSMMSHFFIFKQKTDNPQIRKDHLKEYPELFKEASMLKTFECIACGDFVLYNPITGQRYFNNGIPIKMKVLPPNSRHHAPPNKK